MRCCETAYVFVRSVFLIKPSPSSQFEIVPEEDPQNAIAASSALTCHSNLLKAIGALRYLLAVQTGLQNQWMHFIV